MKNKTIVYVLVAALAVVAIVLLIRGSGPAGNPARPNSGQSAKPPAKGPVGPASFSPSTTVVAVPLTAAKLAAALPADFPSEAGGKLLQNLQLQDPQNHTTKILRTTTTGKSLADNLAAYQAYLAKDNWTIGKVTDLPTLKAVSADNGSRHLDITISYDGGSKSNIVVVSYTVPQQ